MRSDARKSVQKDMGAGTWGRVGNRPPWKKSRWAMPTLEILTVA